MQRFILAIVLSFTFVIGNSQIPADSVLINSARSAFELTNSAPDSAYTIANKILQQTLPAHKLLASAFAYKAKGWALLRLGNYDSSLHNLLISAQIFRQINDTVETMYMYANLASAYSANSQFKESADYLLRADSLAKEKNDIRIEASVQKQMGILYREQQDFKKAIPYFKEGMRLYMSDKDTTHYLDVLISLSINYNMMSLPDSSLSLLERNIPVMKEFRGSTYQSAMLQERFGDTYFAMNNYKKALETYKQAYHLFASDDNHADQAYESFNIGKTYLQVKDYQNAEHYLLTAYRMNDSLHLVNYAGDAAEALSQLYQNTGNWQKAFQWLQTTRTLKDSLHLNQQNEKIAELQTKYETEKKDNEISLLKKDQELNTLTIQKQQTFKYGAAVVLILILLLALLAVNRYRTVQRAKRQIEMEKLRNDIARDLHDDMGSVLSSINIMSKVALDMPHGKDNIRENLAKIRENSANMLESMSDIVWAINPANDSFEKILFRMKEFASDVLDPLDIQYQFNISDGLQEVPLSLRKRKDIFLLFKEVINNAAKHSHCTKINIEVNRQQDFILMRIEDNGKGFNIEGKQQSGNGLRNMQQRAQQMKAGYSIDSEPGKGTSVQVKIKIT